MLSSKLLILTHLRIIQALAHFADGGAGIAHDLLGSVAVWRALRKLSRAGFHAISNGNETIGTEWMRGDLTAICAIFVHRLEVARHRLEPARCHEEEGQSLWRQADSFHDV